MAEYPLNGNYGNDYAGQILTGTLAAVKEYVCTGLGYLLPLAAGQIRSPQQLLFYALAASAGASACAPSPPPAPNPIPVPPGINPAYGCGAGVLYRLWFRTTTWNYTGNSCPDIQQQYFQGVTDFVDFFGPLPGNFQEIRETRIVPIYACRRDELGRWIRYQSGVITLETYLAVRFIDGAGVTRQLFSSSSPSSIVSWERLYVDRRDGNQDQCGDTPVPPPQFFLPPPSGTPVDPVRVFPVPINLPDLNFSLPVQIGPIYLQPTFAPELGLYINNSPVSIVVNPSGTVVVNAPEPLNPYYPPAPNPSPFSNPVPKPFQPSEGGGNIPECLEENICTDFGLQLASEDCEGNDKEVAFLEGKQGLRGLAEVIQESAKWLYSSLLECPEPEAAKVDLLCTGDFPDDTTVRYCLIPVGYDWVRLTITDYEEEVVSAYKLAGTEVEARFGWAALSLGDSDSSLRTYVVTRETTFPIPQGQPTTLSLRISLKRTCFYQVEGIFLGR